MYFKVGQTDILHYQIEVWVRFPFQARAPLNQLANGPWTTVDHGALVKALRPLAAKFIQLPNVML